MYVIVRLNHDEGDSDFYGPFPTIARAKEYAKSFDGHFHYTIYPLIVPNCVQVKLMY